MHEAVGAIHPNARLIERLYQSLKAGDARAAADCYTDEAFFEDIAFSRTGRHAIYRMWRLVGNAEALEVSFNSNLIAADDGTGRGDWVASYILGGRPVENHLTSTFRFERGKIARHSDDCNPMAWASQAFPFPISLAMGRIGLLRRLLASLKLWKFERDHPE